MLLIVVVPLNVIRNNPFIGSCSQYWYHLKEWHHLGQCLFF